MKFLGNTDIIITLAVVFYALGLLGVYLRRTADRNPGHAIWPLFLACMFFFFSVNRYGKIGVNSPALQLLFLISFTMPVLLYYINRLFFDPVGARENSRALNENATYISFGFALLLILLWFLYALGLNPGGGFTNPHYLFYFLNCLYLYTLVLNPDSRISAGASVLALAYIFIFFFFQTLFGTRDVIPEVFRYWSLFYWAMPAAMFIFMLRGAQATPARLLLSLPVFIYSAWILWRMSSPMHFSLYLLLQILLVALSMYLEKRERAIRGLRQS